MCTVLLPPGDNPIAVNKYNSSGFLVHVAEGVLGLGSIVLLS
jgi:hypothetical protein